MLTQMELDKIKQLQEICEESGHFQLKLNFDMLENRDGNEKEDFFYYEGDKLLGFLGSYGMGGAQIELCGMVHPDYRRRGIFSKLLEEALLEAKKRHFETILLNSPTDSQSGREFLTTIPCTFTFAEYQMKWHQTELLEDASIVIRPSTTTVDLEAEVQLDILGFGNDEKEAREFNLKVRDNTSEQSLIIETNEKTVGKIRVSELNGEAWIYGFVVFPELQGKGIGRKALSKVVKMENEKGLSVFLEVEAKNAHALKLYESCGFHRYHSQDYYLYQS
jgi:ribosomal protein S18 acetylase RimI-like enzyme